MLFSAMQGAAIIAAHATVTKLLLSFTLRTYQFLETDQKRLKDVTSNYHVQQFEKAQVNESEYAALLVASLLYIGSTTIGKGGGGSQGATLAVVGQIGYVWCRTALGYPNVPTITFAVIRYGGLALIVAELWKLAFP